MRVLLLVLLSVAPAMGGPSVAELEATAARLERLLLENIVPFWQDRVIDAESGGYRLNHDASGQWLGPADKALVTQARTVWFFARLYNSRYGSEEHLEAARHGYEFLRDKLWDRESGGFFWAVDEKGIVATRPHKHLYGQGFALYALAEYAEAGQDSGAAHLAGELFSLLEEKAHDAEYGGYVEWFRRDWSPAPEGGNSYMGTPPDLKLMNTHLHLLEPFTTYYLLSDSERVRERLIELIFVQSNAVVRKDVGACTDKYARDWTPLLDPEYARVSYGHDIENVWLLVEACDAAGIANGPLVDLYRQLVDYSLEYGFDHEQGGFYDSGAFNRPADSRSKIWWVQAEGLVALLTLYQLTGEERYWESFTRTLDWVGAHQTDWENGDWHAEIRPDGTASGGKAHAWKSPYHNGRAMLECLEIIEALRAEAGD